MDKRQPGKLLLAYEISRPYALLAAYFVAAHLGYWWLAIPIALTVYMAAFVQLHDAMHSCLGVGRRLNDALMSISALFLYKSGHGVRCSHLQHHQLELKEGDLEGTPALWPLYKVVLTGPWYALKLRFLVFNLAKPKIRRIMVGENMVNVVQILASYYFGVVQGLTPILIYWLMVIVLTCLMPVWASWIPHHVPERHPWVKWIKSFGRPWTPALNSYFFHERHHERPRVPARDLHRDS